MLLFLTVDNVIEKSFFFSKFAACFLISLMLNKFTHSRFCILQYLIYKEIKERFHNHLWLDVISKSDLLQESPVVFVSEDTTADDDEIVQYRKKGPDGAIHVSVKGEQGLNEVIDFFLFRPYTNLFSLC